LEIKHTEGVIEVISKASGELVLKSKGKETCELIPLERVFVKAEENSKVCFLRLLVRDQIAVSLDFTQV
jgi:hypothetical protein